MFFSEYMNLGCKGHANFEFVDAQLDSDNRIFIDPAVYWHLLQIIGA